MRECRKTIHKDCHALRGRGDDFLDDEEDRENLLVKKDERLQ